MNLSSLSEKDLFLLLEAAKYGQAYARKLKQYAQGKINLAVEGTEPPYNPGVDGAQAIRDMVDYVIEELERAYDSVAVEEVNTNA